MQRLAGKEGAGGILADWWKEFSTTEALNRPMAQLFALNDAEQDFSSEEAIENNSSTTQKP